jgi:hypothetical protein
VQGEEHHVRLGRLELVIEKCDGDLADGGGDLLRRERRNQVEDGRGLGAFFEDALAIGGNS